MYENENNSGHDDDDDEQVLKSVSLFIGNVKKRRSSISAGHSSNEEGEGADGIGRMFPTPPGDSPSVRKQPRRHVKPRSYCDLLDYDSDLEWIGGLNSTSPGRRRTPGLRNAG